jgi:7-cyano-7-deazaguanine reductase
MRKIENDNLSLLGQEKTNYLNDYNPNVLEYFCNAHEDTNCFIKFNCPEFTSLCPITGQPDFATLYINYIPNKKLVESKSLKLYLFSYRNHGDFHEDCVITIKNDLVNLLEPNYLEVWGKFLPRGGISIDPYVNYGLKETKWEKFAEERLLKHDIVLETIDNR